MNYKPAIGLEVHVELKTNSKMFCGCSADYFGKEPNTHVCPVCLGLPGALPVPNKTAIEWCIMIGLALNCEISLFSKFDRKNYFYPDLPKGYQISQYDEPFAINGWIEIARRTSHVANSMIDERQTTNHKRIRIRRVHMEEDTAKLVHQFGTQNSTLRLRSGRELKTQNFSLIDFNRSGVPLVEIVTEPDFESAQDVIKYLKKLQQIVRYLNVSNADMEKGDMRLEPNISLREISNVKSQMSNFKLPNYKVEVKNINSFKFVEKAINYEVERQKKLLEKGETPVQETRGWNEKKGITQSQRTKEEAQDYRYFPEPDIPPVRWTEFQISNFKLQMPELPDKKLERFQKEYGLPYYESEILTRERDLADYFEEGVKVGTPHSLSPKQIANTIINKKIDIQSVLPAELIQQILSSAQKAVVDEAELEKVIKRVLEEHKKAVLDYKNGKESAIMFLIGQVIRTFKEKVDATRVKERIEEEIKG